MPGGMGGFGAMGGMPSGMGGMPSGMGGMGGGMPGGSGMFGMPGGFGGGSPKQAAVEKVSCYKLKFFKKDILS